MFQGYHISIAMFFALCISVCNFKETPTNIQTDREMYNSNLATCLQVCHFSLKKKKKIMRFFVLRYLL